MKAEEVRSLVVMEQEVESKAGAPSVAVVTQFLEKFRLEKVKIELRAVSLAPRKNCPPHEVVIQRLLVMNPLGKIVIPSVEGASILEGRVPLINDRTENTSGVLRMSRVCQTTKQNQGQRALHRWE